MFAFAVACALAFAVAFAFAVTVAVVFVIAFVFALAFAFAFASCLLLLCFFFGSNFLESSLVGQKMENRSEERPKGANIATRVRRGCPLRGSIWKSMEINGNQ